MNKLNLNAALINFLESDNEEVLLEALIEIRANGDITIAPILIDILNKVDRLTISNEIVNLLVDIRDLKIITILLEEIESKKHEKILDKIVSVCWQSGLNYANYISVFSKLVANAPIIVAIEAFTVVETNIENLNHEQIHEQIDLLKSEIKNCNNDNKVLISELIGVLSEHNCS